MSQSPLLKILRDLIAHSGPISVGTYMAQCLGHPQHGYYMAQEAFGAQGDFITAPEISQLFGEMLALWVILSWEQLGKPNDIQLVELGPGRGTLMQDIWRGLSAVPDLRDAVTIHLVEFSPRLQAIQKQALEDLPVIWHNTIATLPARKSLIIANEFFDALPVNQAIFHGGVWHERLIGIENGHLAFTQGKALAGIPPAAKNGTVYEYAPAINAIMEDLCRFIAQNGGALLAIDYGNDVPLDERFGETLQAVKEHAFVDILSEPGTSDLTTHVAFSALAAIALEEFCAVLPIQTQREFLTQFGIRLRAEKLAVSANDAQKEALHSGLHRLVDPGEMGDLFKVLQVFKA